MHRCPCLFFSFFFFPLRLLSFNPFNLRSMRMYKKLQEKNVCSDNLFPSFSLFLCSSLRTKNFEICPYAFLIQPRIPFRLISPAKDNFQNTFSYSEAVEGSNLEKISLNLKPLYFLSKINKKDVKMKEHCYVSNTIALPGITSIVANKLFSILLGLI